MSAPISTKKLGPVAAKTISLAVFGGRYFLRHTNQEIALIIIPFLSVF